MDEEGEKGGDVEGELGEEELEEQEGEVRRYPREKPQSVQSSSQLKHTPLGPLTTCFACSEGLYTAQEEADLRECLRSTSIPEEAVARFKKMVSRPSSSTYSGPGWKLTSPLAALPAPSMPNGHDLRPKAQGPLQKRPSEEGPRWSVEGSRGCSSRPSSLAATRLEASGLRSVRERGGFRC